eukprot:CAMPEP_0194173408 /NCGR_PEP_ID=MMETSP0154-20130528/7758_1 /TAXON_ID=1049557 /ORGANISM="Thalassiothrix antarctica, Strain L6-D1" /LENGTH=131 /DNA_ID=CAMNT_0038886473 /DNA_START=13 /DNA_END=404 /DNA_ORIENTATION=-
MAIKEKKTNAKDPAIDLLFLLIGHGLLLPKRRPSISAMPSPAAIVHKLVTPAILLFQNKTIAKNKMMVYTKGPPMASLLLPDRETALANSCSLEFPVEATYNRHALINGTHAAKHRPDGENKGHNDMYSGA